VEGFWFIVAPVGGAKMKQETEPIETAEQHVRDLRRATRKKYSAEAKIKIVWYLQRHHDIKSTDAIVNRICGAGV